MPGLPVRSDIMLQATGKHVLLVGSSYQSTAPEWRERLLMPGAEADLLAQALHAEQAVEESMVIATCNRVEACVLCRKDWPVESLLSLLAERHGLTLETYRPHAYEYAGEAALLHLFGLCSGLHSQMLGETEILGQVKKAYGDAQERGSVGRVLHRVLQKSFQAAKWARSHTGIAQGQVSLGNVAVDLAVRIFGDLQRSRVLVVGSGEVGRDTVKALHSRGCLRVAISSRTESRARSLAEEIQGTVLPFDQWRDSLLQVDVAIFATAAPGALIRLSEMDAFLERRAGRPLLVIDLAVPRDVEMDVTPVSELYFYTFDDLAAIANENLAARQAEIERCQQGLQQRATALWAKLGGEG